MPAWVNMNGWALEEEDDRNENVNDEVIEDEDFLLINGRPRRSHLILKSEDEEVEAALEVDVAPEATIGTSTQKPYVIRDFPRGNMLIAEILKSKDKIGEKEREILDHDLGDVERTLGNVLERLMVLESGENATLMYRNSWMRTCGLGWPWARMDALSAGGGDGAGGDGAGGAGVGGAGACGAGAGGAGTDGAGIGGARPVEAEVTRCTYMTFMKCNPHSFKGTEGAVDWDLGFMGIDGLIAIPWLEEESDDRGVLSSKCVAKTGARIVQLKIKRD
ncbi:hypothetical protein Tco_1182147 [Tanacetum coccineum]